MSEILGKDCDGRPLRAGDRIEWIDSPETISSLVGVQTEVVRAVPARDAIFMDAIMGVAYRDYVWLANGRNGPTQLLRRLDDDDEASWEKIEEKTKWRPPVGEVEA